MDMVDNAGRIKELEEELSNTKYNKSTQHHIGLLKAKIAKLKEKVYRTGSGGGGGGYDIKKSGDATVCLLGFPSVGKSTLLNSLTNAESEVAEYEFTTLDVIPGVMEYKHAKIQILDVPGIVEGAALGRGRGREVLSVLRSADMVLTLIDVNQPRQYNALLKEIYDAGLRVNQKYPDVKIRKTDRGGICVGSTIKLTKIDYRTIQSILKEYRIMNADVVIRTDIDDSEFIDVVERNKKYVKGINVINKADTVEPGELERVRAEINPDLSISAKSGKGIEELKELIFDSLDFIRVYCKEVNQKADLEEPLIMRQGSSIKEMCERLHKDFVKNFKYAKVWGKSAKFPGQVFKQPRHVLQDGDIVEIHVK